MRRCMGVLLTGCPRLCERLCEIVSTCEVGCLDGREDGCRVG